MRVDLEVPFEEKDEAQSLGAKWDKDKRTWKEGFKGHGHS